IHPGTGDGDAAVPEGRWHGRYCNGAGSHHFRLVPHDHGWCGRDLVAVPAVTTSAVRHGTRFCRGSLFVFLGFTACDPTDAVVGSGVAGSVTTTRSSGASAGTPATIMLTTNPGARTLVVGSTLEVSSGGYSGVVTWSSADSGIARVEDLLYAVGRVALVTA